MYVGGNNDRALYVVGLALNPHAYISYSQFGEDLLIDVIFSAKEDPGFYVDVGAHHPQRFSNTHLLYERGWRGINVEGDSALLDSFMSARTRDINLCAIVSDVCEEVSFNTFSDSAVNTISEQKAKEYSHYWDIVASNVKISTTLEKILDGNLPLGQQIDLLSVDAEGVDLKVLKGNNWKKYRPYLIVVEADGIDLMNASMNPTVTFLHEQGYRLHGLIHISAFFIRI